MKRNLQGVGPKERAFNHMHLGAGGRRSEPKDSGEGAERKGGTEHRGALPECKLDLSIEREQPALPVECAVRRHIRKRECGADLHGDR